MNDVKRLCEFFGGSQLYHLNTPESDVDQRGLYMNTDAKHIIGTARNEEYRKQNAAIKEDIVYKELSAWVRLLFQGNTEAFEILFANQNEFTYYTPEIDAFRKKADKLIDSRKLLNVLRGYAQSEFRLAKGERVGVLGSKRKNALDKYGYSHRNATHLIRLLNTGIVFFKTGKYIVDCREFDKEIYDLMYRIKTQPDTYSVAMLESEYNLLDKEIVAAYEMRTKTFSFSESIANNLLLECYFPDLQREYNALSSSS